MEKSRFTSLICLLLMGMCACFSLPPVIHPVYAQSEDYVLYFDGDGDYVTVADSASLNFSGDDFTISAWFKTTATDYPSFLYKGDASWGVYWCMMVDGTGLLEGQVGDDVDYYEVESGNITYDDEWHYGVFTRESTTIKLYLDNWEEDSFDCDAVNGDTNQPLLVGNDVDDYFFTGFLDEIRIFSRTLNATEIEYAYDNRREVLDETGLVLWFDFDEGTGVTTTDESTNGNDGTITDAQYCPYASSFNSISQDSPSSGATKTQWTVDFYYTVTFSDTPKNACLRLFNSTHLVTTIWNTTSLQNATSVNYGSYTFSDDDAYKWNCIYYNSLGLSLGSGNRTLTMSLEPHYRNIGENVTVMWPNGTVSLYAQGYDTEGLDYAWLWTDESQDDRNTTFAYTWTQKADMTYPRLYAEMATVGGKVYVIGGRSVPSNGRMAYNEMYDPSTNTWTTKAPIPTVEDAGSIGVYKGNIYVAGGCPDGQKHYVYFPSNNTWSDAPADLDWHQWWDCGGVVVGDYFYVMGGANTKKIHKRYSFASNSWTFMANMTYDHSFFGATVFDNEIYVFGSGDPVARKVEKYTIANDTWTTLNDLPSESSHTWASPVVIGDFIYLFFMGGSSAPNNFYAYDPLEDTYLNLTSFTELYALNIQQQIVAINNTIYHCGGGYMTYSNSTSDEYNGTWAINIVEVPPVYTRLNGVADTWTWSNFTWSNSSMPVNTAIQWRIYYVDTAGNVNATTIYTFTIMTMSLYDPWFIHKVVIGVTVSATGVIIAYRYRRKKKKRTESVP